MPSQRASRLHSISNFCPTVGWRNRSLSSRPTFVPGVFSARRRAHLSAGLIHGEGGVKRSPHKHMCVSEISGWEWADWDENRKQLRGWRRWLLRAGFTESDTGGRRMIDFFFFFLLQQSILRHIHTHTLLSVLSSCLRLFSITPSPASWSSSSSPIICSVLSLVFLFTCLIISPSSFFNRAVIGEHWTPMIQSHPYSLTSELFPSPRPGLHITQHCACRLCSPPLLFHTFCLAFKSSSFTYPPDLPTVKKKSWHGITSKRLGKLFRASHGAPFPHRNYCWNKQLWEVAALVDPSLLTISEPLSAIAKTLSHRRAVMIALPSWGRKKKKKKRMIRERERRAIAGFFL